MRARAAFTAGAVAALAVVLPARAASCVYVVVDDGAHTPTRHCTTAAYGDTAAAVLAARAKEVHRPAPRYNGNFLCGIDGYPETGCGTDGGNPPYWSFWIWVRGAWTYSQVGVDSYAVEDADHDGVRDPIGFHYTPFESKTPPRANGVPPAPPTTPPPHSTTTPPAATTTAPAAPAATTRATTTTNAPTPAPTRTPPPPPRATATAPPTTSTPDAVEPAATPTRHRRGIPAGTVAGALLAAVLIGAAVMRSRRAGPP